MAKNKISEWSSTPANNTDVGGIDIAEGCAPSGINNAIREMMAQVKDMQAGTDGDNFTVGGNLAVTGTTTFTGAVTLGALSTTGNTTLGDGSGDVLTITGTAVSIPNNLNFDSNTLYIDSTNNRIGVGTSSPSTALQVSGTVTATAFAGPLTGAVTGNVTGDVTGNVSGSSGSCTGNSATTTLATKSSTLSAGGGNGTAMTFNWSGQSGQPTWLWGGSDGSNMYVYNPSNFSVSYATSAGSASSASSATNATNATYATVCTTAIGYGQTWSNPSNAHNTSYHNTTGKPIMVSYGGSSGAKNVWVYLQASSDNVNWVTVAQAFTSADDDINGGSLSAIIPNNWYYRSTGTAWGSPLWSVLS